jgi:hypothetical protein
MSTEEKMSGQQHPYLVWDEKNVLDSRVGALWVAVNALCNGCTTARLHYTPFGRLFSTAQDFVTRLRQEMKTDEIYIDCENRPEYVAGMKALDDGAKEMLAVKNRGDEVERKDGTGGMASVAQSYEWLYKRLMACKQKQTEYEEGWAALRKFDEDLGAAQAMIVRGQGLYHAFRRQIFKSSFKSTFKSIFKSKHDKAKTSKTDMDAIRGLLAEMGHCKTGACV